MRFVLSAATGAVAIAACLFGPGRAPSALVLHPGAPVTEIIATAPRGATVVLAPGVHEGFAVTRAVNVSGLPGSAVVGQVTVRADGARLSDLLVFGESNGITVRDAQGVVLDRIAVLGAQQHGIEAVGASVTVRACHVAALTGPFAQGIEIRMPGSRPMSLVEGCVLDGGQEGIVTHAARVTVRANHVTGTTMRGIAITEMSEGMVEENRVTHVTGAGLFCGDMSHCAFRENAVSGVASDGTGVRSTSGYGLVGWYYVTMQERGGSFEDTEAGPIRVAHGSLLTDRFPLSTWPHGWRGILPGLLVVAVSLGVLCLIRLALALARRRRLSAGGMPAVPRAALLALAWGFGVQTFHMLEHVVQVFQVYVANATQRQGLLGAHVNAEWMHLAYNVAVVGFLVWALLTIAPRGARMGAGWLQAAVILQAYHVVEHVAKVTQHSLGAAKPAPGIVGGELGLVWFHFGINLAVYAGLAAAMGGLLARRPWSRHTRRATLAT